MSKHHLKLLAQFAPLYFAHQAGKQTMFFPKKYQLKHTDCRSSWYYQMASGQAKCKTTKSKQAQHVQRRTAQLMPQMLQLLSALV
jgi:hypothetical protein